MEKQEEASIALRFVSSCRRSLCRISSLWLGEGAALAVSQVELSAAPWSPALSSPAVGRRVESQPICHAESLLGENGTGQDPQLPEAGRGSVRALGPGVSHQH